MRFCGQHPLTHDKLDLLGLCGHITTDMIDSVLSATDTITSRPPQRAPVTGIERCASRNAVLLLNTYPSAVPLKPFEKLMQPAPVIEPGVDVLNFEWSVGPNRFIECGDIVVQMSQDSYLQHLDPNKLVMKIKRYEDDRHSYISIDCSYTDGDFQLVWTRHLYMAPNGQELRGTDTLKTNIDCFVGIRFILNPTFTLHNEGEKIYINFPSKPQAPRVEKKKNSAYPDTALPKTSAATKRPTSEQHEWLYRGLGATETLLTDPHEANRIILLLKECDAHQSQTFKWSFSKTSSLDSSA
jgi:hypothetical protein